MHKGGIETPYGFLMRGGRLSYGAFTANSATWRRNDGNCSAMGDLIFLGAGLGVFAVMALYAYACDNL